MPINVLGGQKVYTVPEMDTKIDEIIAQGLAGFEIVDKLPTLASATVNRVYYKKTKKTITDTWYSNPSDPTDTSDEQDATHTVEHTAERPVLQPYLKGKDAHNDDCWYTSGSGSAGDHRGMADEEILEIWRQEMGTPKRYKLIRASKVLAEIDDN